MRCRHSVLSSPRCLTCPTSTCVIYCCCMSPLYLLHHLLHLHHSPPPCSGSRPISRCPYRNALTSCNPVCLAADPRSAARAFALCPIRRAPRGGGGDGGQARERAAAHAAAAAAGGGGGGGWDKGACNGNVHHEHSQLINEAEWRARSRSCAAESE